MDFFSSHGSQSVGDGSLRGTALDVFSTGGPATRVMTVFPPPPPRPPHDPRYQPLPTTEPLPGTLQWLPDWIDVDKVAHDLQVDSVSAPDEFIQPLQHAVSQARSRHIDLKVAFFTSDGDVQRTVMQDLADSLQKKLPNSTILTISPGHTGASSPVFSRDQLERSEDYLPGFNPVQATELFTDRLSHSSVPWSAITVVGVVIVTAAIVIGGFVRRRLLRKSAT